MSIKKIKNKLESKRKSKKIIWRILILFKDSIWLTLRPFHFIRVQCLIVKNRVLNVVLHSDDKGRAPDFLIIGAQKAGTTSLWHHLKQHPQIEMAPNVPKNLDRGRTKEMHFFNNDENWAKGIKFYKSSSNDNDKRQS